MPPQLHSAAIGKRAAMCMASVVELTLIAGCAIVAPSAAPEVVTVPIQTGGQLQEIDLTLHSCEVIEPTIYFPRRELHNESLLRLVGAQSGEGWKQISGVPLRLKVTFSRQANDPGSLTSVLWRSIDVTTDTIKSWSDEDVGRIFGSTTLPAGRYRVAATLVEGSPQLSGLHPTFVLWSSFKVSPSAENCSEPPSR